MKRKPSLSFWPMSPECSRPCVSSASFVLSSMLRYPMNTWRPFIHTWCSKVRDNSDIITGVKALDFHWWGCLLMANPAPPLGRIALVLSIWQMSDKTNGYSHTKLLCLYVLLFNLFMSFQYMIYDIWEKLNWFGEFYLLISQFKNISNSNISLMKTWP